METATYTIKKTEFMPSELQMVKGENTRLRREVQKLRHEIEAIKQTLQQPEDEPEEQPDYVAAAIEAIQSQYPAFSRIHLETKSKKRAICEPRQLFQYIIRNNTRLSLEEIGGICGGRDHATVKNSIRVIMDMRETDRGFERMYQAIMKRFYNLCGG